MQGWDHGRHPEAAREARARLSVGFRAPDSSGVGACLRLETPKADQTDHSYAPVDSKQISPPRHIITRAPQLLTSQSHRSPALRTSAAPPSAHAPLLTSPLLRLTAMQHIPRQVFTVGCLSDYASVLHALRPTPLNTAAATQGERSPVQRSISPPPANRTARSAVRASVRAVSSRSSVATMGTSQSTPRPWHSIADA